MAEQFPLTLERVFFTRTSVIALSDHKCLVDGALKHKPDNQILVTPLENAPGRYLATMRTKLNPDADPSDPYSIDMECIGVFSVDDTLTPAAAERGLLITGHSVLYGAIREAVSWITGRSPHGSLMLGLSVIKHEVIEPSEGK